MNLLDVIAQPFIERDFNTPHIDKAIESERRNRKNALNQRMMQNMKYYRITDDCGFQHEVCAEDNIDPMLAPHTRAAQRITKEEYDDYIMRTDYPGAARISAWIADSRENHGGR